ncbi:unnamed protein product, partial [Ectocarpus sp. 12 AP-2014]
REEQGHQRGGVRPRQDVAQAVLCAPGVPERAAVVRSLSNRQPHARDPDTAAGRWNRGGSSPAPPDLHVQLGRAAGRAVADRGEVAGGG